FGCGDGTLTAALCVNDSYLVHGLDANPGDVERAREHIRSLGIYGKVSTEHWSGKRLPYIDNLVNLFVSQDPGEILMDEVLRVLAPNGVAYIKRGDTWVRTTKPRPKEIDEWTHYLHDANNNAVANDSVVGPPRRLQWTGSPKWGRHHDRMSSVSAVVSAGGRVFYIFDEASRLSVLIPPKWTLIARDAFNGVILWKRPIDKWHTHLWPLKSGPAQLPRRLVAAGDRVFVTLGLDQALVALDAATGETVQTYEKTKSTEEIIFSDSVLFLLVNQDDQQHDFTSLEEIKRGYGGKFWDEATREIVALDAGTGDVLWTAGWRVLPGTLAADHDRIVFHNGECIVCLDRDTGDKIWRSEPVSRSEEIRSFYVPTLVLYEDVVLFSGGETAGLQKGAWYTSGKDTLTALSAETGSKLWTAYHPPSGYRSPEDILVVNGLVWTGETTSGRAVGVFTGRDLHTGEVKSEFPPDVETYWFHHRCYRGKATEKYLLMARAGTEFIDVRDKHWIPHHWFRGACLYGVMPANGLIYAPQHPCACYLESKLDGFNALAAASVGPRFSEDATTDVRLEKGPVYGEAMASKASGDDWPTYRHDTTRSGHASTIVPNAVKQAWQTKLGGKLTSPVVADKIVFVASIDTHTLHALDATSSKHLWEYVAGGRIDSPPTIYQGRVLFGSADGWVYCLRAADGALAWRFRAAPMDQRLTAFEQVESVWPVHGSVLVENDVLYCVAGRSMFLDSGMRLWRLDPRTGRVLSETILNDSDQATGKTLQSYVSWLNMPAALPDILSSDGRFIYMRSQPFHPDGTRLPLKAMPRGNDADRGAPPPTQHDEHAHLFCPTGFLDDSWWHRTYWMYGSTFVSGWCGYYLAGKVAPAGRILVFDDSKVYGFGRKPQYYRWTTPIEHHLFAADKKLPASNGTIGTKPRESRIRIGKSNSLNPAGKPVTIEAWVQAEKPGGVVLARGGNSHGYALYLQRGCPHFAVRNNQKLHLVIADQKIVGRWTHLAGVLTAEKGLMIYVDGKLAASAEASGLITADPHEGMEIGADEGSIVGDYKRPFPFTGLIDEVRIYHRTLSADEIEKSAANAGRTDVDSSDLALYYSFDKGNAVDTSGNENHGKVQGTESVPGKISLAMKFTGRAKARSDFVVKHHFKKELPLLARAMILSGKTLFIAGPPDLVDEEEAFSRVYEREAQAKLVEQNAALEGEKGAYLWTVSAADGKKLNEYQLDALPVFDGMAAANERLYMSTTDGRVLCFAAQ
ncbi:MAG: PQQ-binding-like beta-propeller repeat protein, partial [Planctomycetota bacterium]